MPEEIRTTAAVSPFKEEATVADFADRSRNLSDDD